LHLEGAQLLAVLAINNNISAWERVCTDLLTTWHMHVGHMQMGHMVVRSTMMFLPCKHRSKS
jgi:hypothetical protein